MGFREVSVVEVREVLRGWLELAGLRKVAERAGVDRKTARRYVQAAEAEGLSRLRIEGEARARLGRQFADVHGLRSGSERWSDDGATPRG